MYTESIPAPAHVWVMVPYWGHKPTNPRRRQSLHVGDSYLLHLAGVCQVCQVDDGHKVSYR